MPQKRVPKLSRHKHTGLAYVTLNGRRIYLGKWNHSDRDAKYHSVLAQWERAGRRYPFDNPGETTLAQSDVMVIEVCAAFLEFAKTYYVHPDGTPTGQLARVKSALDGVQKLFADVSAEQFGPVKLDAVRARWIADGLSRSTINSMTGVVKLAFRWAASKEMIPAAVSAALAALGGLKRGRSGAKEPEPVRPVLTAHVEAVLPFLSRQVRAMVQLQMLTGARPGEIVTLTGSMINRDGRVWTATLDKHKNSYRGQQRTLEFGPQAQEILRPWLLERPLGSYLFSPREAERERRAACPTHRPPFAVSKPKTRRKVGEYYTTLAYAQCLRRACDKAGVPAWSPNRLRHTFATQVRRLFGLEAAQVVLGHSQADVTQVYAERNTALARTVIEQIG